MYFLPFSIFVSLIIVAVAELIFPQLNQLPCTVNSASVISWSKSKFASVTVNVTINSLLELFTLDSPATFVITGTSVSFAIGIVPISRTVSTL